MQNDKKAYIKWQTLAIATPISIFFILAGLLNLAGMEYTTPPDLVCTDCYSQIQVNSSVWEIKVEYADDKDIIFKKQTRSRTLYLNLDKIDEFVNTNPKIPVEILVPTIKKYSTYKHPEYGYLRPLKDGDKLIERKNKYNPDGDRFIIHGLTSGQTVKWGLELEHYLMEDIEFDPFWYGTTVGERIWFNPPTPYANESYRITEFINVSGTNFTLAGQPYKFVGTDSYYITDYATNLTFDDDGNQINNSRQYATELLNEMQFLNINVFRTWAGISCGGRGSTAWNQSAYGGHFNCFENDVPGNFNETMFEALDWVIYQASLRDIRVMPVLVNNWNDYGGMRWYVQQSPTTIKTYENETDTSFANWSSFHDQFYNDSNAIIYFQNFTNYTLNRNNTYSGILYKDDPAIFAWMLVNEPRAVSDANRNNDLLRNWTINMTNFIKSVDTNHLVGLGIEGWGNPWEGTEFIDNHNGTGVDFTTYALHPDQWEFFLIRSEGPTDGYWMNETFNQTSIDWWTNWTNLSWNNIGEGPGYASAYSPALGRHGYQDWVRQHVNWSNQLDMPIILQEVGVKTFHKTEDKDIFYNQTIFNFYETGGDGLLLWTLNHDEYYYSTDVNGTMDDGFGFYVSDDTFLHNKSISPIRALDYAMVGGWINILNSFKYDFVLNADLAGIHNTSTKSDYCVGNWWFEQNGSDVSGNGNDGTIAGNVLNTTGIVGYGYEFDGLGYYIAIADDDSLEKVTSFTMMFWVKYDVGAVNDIEFLRKGSAVPLGNQQLSVACDGTDNNCNGYGFGGSISTGTMYFAVSTGNLTTGETNRTTGTGFLANTWTHLVGVKNDTALALYKDGVFLSSILQTGGNVSTTYGLELNVNYVRRFNGSMDEVLMFNRSLSSGEISQIYNDSLKTQPSPGHLKNSTLYINTYDGVTWGGWSFNQTNSSALSLDTDYTFTTQFGNDVEQFKWNIQTCDSYDLCINGSIGTVYLGTDPVVTLISPKDYVRFAEGGTIEFNYNVTDSLDIGNCQLYIDNVLNKTDSVIIKDITQTFTVNSFSNITHLYIWRVECTNVGDNLGITENRTFRGGNTFPTQSAPNIGAHAYVNRNYVVGSWRFEQFGSGAGEVFDETGLNNGTLVGNVMWCPDWGDSQKYNCSGRVGKGIMIDGTWTKYVNIPNNYGSLQMDYITSCAWVQPKGSNVHINLGGIAFRDGGGGSPNRTFQFNVDLTNKRIVSYVCNCSQDCINSNSAINSVPYGIWTHVCFTFDGNTVTPYVDGVNTTSTAYTLATGMCNPTHRSIYIGNWPMNGTIDEVTIWNRSLSAKEIRQLYNSTFRIQDISASNNLTQDNDNDTIKFIYDWHLNNRSIAMLNMPMEAVNNGSEMNFSKDYSDNENHATTTSFNSDVFSCIGSGSTRSCSGWNRTGGYDGRGAYEFDGVGDIITLPTTSVLEPSAITLSAWIKYHGVGYQGVFGHNLYPRIATSSNDLDVSDMPDQAAGAGVDLATSGDKLTEGVWNHIAVTYSDVSPFDFKIYINGKEEASTTGTSALDSWSSTSWTIGARRTSDYFFNGTIDEVLIFNRSLSAEQVKTLYYNQTQTIKAQETEIDNEWLAYITPNDGYGDGTERCSNYLLIEPPQLKEIIKYTTDLFKSMIKYLGGVM